MNRNILAVLISTIMLLATTAVLGADPIVTESTSNSNVNSTAKSETTVKRPPPSAKSPGINASKSD